MSRTGHTQAGGAVRKRQKIDDSAKQMFMWIAGMSVVVGAALVVAWFLWQQIAFTSKVIGEKNSTVDVLVQNNEAAQELRDNIRVLETNAALSSAKARDDQRALQVILDALPADANSLALGASLQERLAAGIGGLSIDRMSVDPASSEGDEDVVDEPVQSPEGAADSGESEPQEDGIEGAGAQQITLQMIVIAQNANALSEFLQRLERSIRVIDIDTLRLERSDQEYTLTIDARGYFEPARTIELGSKVVTP